ncbi:MAG: hypothetical protein WC453_04715 [Patescibacteria group bacterium]
MTDQELITKLNSLRKTSPDQNWLKSNRELLLSQISNSGAEQLTVWRMILIDFSSALQAISRPAYALGVLVLLLLSGAVFSHQLLAGAKPNDSLYIARIISEKVKLNTTFDAAARDRLAVQFATEHAQDISAVLADPDFNNEANKAQVAKLNDSFKAEVNTVKDRLSRLQTGKKAPAAGAPADSSVVIAENSKDEEGIKLLAQSEPADGVVALSATGVPSVAVGASTTPAGSEEIVQASSTPEIDAGSDAGKVLDEATKLFDQKDYTKAADKLKEVDEIIK